MDKLEELRDELIKELPSSCTIILRPITHDFFVQDNKHPKSTPPHYISNIVGYEGEIIIPVVGSIRFFGSTVDDLRDEIIDGLQYYDIE